MALQAMNQSLVHLVGLRGATTSLNNTTDSIKCAVNELIDTLVDKNNLMPEQIISITFSVTSA